jgi:hypothetical protein
LIGEHPSDGDIVGGSDAQTPQCPNMSHIPARIFASPYVAQSTETHRAHEIPPLHTLDHTREGLQGESHEDIGYAQPNQHYYPGATRVKRSRTLYINLLVEENLVPLKIQQIPGIFEHVK